jgi:hypothetical protein
VNASKILLDLKLLYNQDVCELLPEYMIFEGIFATFDFSTTIFCNSTDLFSYGVTNFTHSIVFMEVSLKSQARFCGSVIMLSGADRKFAI